MTITAITGFSTTPASNDNLSDISLAEGWAPGSVNNAVRELMSFMADSANGAAGWNVIQTTGTAGTTQTQAGALAITSPIMRISTCATSGDGVKLPTAAANLDVLIINDGAEAAQIWPNTSDAIDGGSADAVDANTLAAGSARRYIAIDATNWYTASDPAGLLASSNLSDLANAVTARSNLGANGNLVSVQVFTASGTWTKPADVQNVLVQLVGGGGGGGGHHTTNPSSSAGGGGGGGATEFIDVTGTSSETVTVGAAGSGGAATTDGGNGGTSSFGSFCSATGGTGGSYGNAAGPGGSGTGGDVNFTGGGGQGGIQSSAPGGKGGGSFLGSGGYGAGENANGGAAGGYGGGGGGTSYIGTPRTGGGGTAGIVIIWEYK